MTFPSNSQPNFYNNKSSTTTDATKLPVIIAVIIIFVTLIYIILVIFFCKYFLKRLLQETEYNDYYKNLKKLPKKSKILKYSLLHAIDPEQKFTLNNEPAVPMIIQAKNNRSTITHSSRVSNTKEPSIKKFTTTNELKVHNANEKQTKKSARKSSNIKHCHSNSCSNLNSNITINSSSKKKQQKHSMKSNQQDYRQIHDRGQILFTI